MFFTKQNDLWKSDEDVVDSLQQLTNSNGEVIGWTYFDAKKKETEFYSPMGRLLSIENHNGLTQTLEYSTSTTPVAVAPAPGLMIKVTDFSGRSINFTYDNSARIKSMSDPSGNQFVYSYEGGTLSSVSHNDGKVRTYKYNDFGSLGGDRELTGIVDENGVRFASYGYSGKAAATTQHNVGGVAVNKYTFIKNSNGSTTVIDPLNTSYTYAFQSIVRMDRNTSIVRTCSGCGGSSSFSYDANGNISSRTDFNGNVTTYSYDLSRNLETSRTEAYGTPQARTITTSWHPAYRLPAQIDEPGRRTTFSYDSNGNLLSKTITDTALNKLRTWSWTYNSLGQVLTEDGPRTDVPDITTYTYYTGTSAGYYTLGDLATVTNAMGQVTTISRYDASGRPLEFTDPNGLVTTLTYDPRGRLKTRTVGSQLTTYDYDGVGQLIKVTSPDGSYLNYTYDAAHRLTDVIDNLGNKVHYTLDLMGNRTAESTYDPASVLTRARTRVYDSLNRLQKEIGGTNPSLQVTQYGYDNNGNLRSITDPLNHVTTNSYDALNRLIQITDPANGVTVNEYDPRDQLTAVTDPRALVTHYAIDALGNKLQTQSPDSGDSTYIYDAAGNITQKTDARGVVSQYAYDALNRVTSITYPASPSENVSFTYDSTGNGNKGKGRLTGYSNDGGATVLTYDVYGNVVQQTEMIGSQIHVTGFQYDNANRLAAITYPSGRLVTYVRNSLGQVAQVQMQDGVGATTVVVADGIAYLPFGSISGIAYGNGVTTSVQYDKDYRIARIITTSTPRWEYVYSYDANGNITQLIDQAGSRDFAYTYDALNRILTDAHLGGYWGYQYDANGNRAALNLNAADPNAAANGMVIPQIYAADSNRQTSFMGISLDYDAAGNLIGTGGGVSLAYNDANRLATANNSINYRYDALGRRTSKDESGSEQLVYLPNGHHLVQLQLNADQTYARMSEYIWLDDTPLARVETLYGSNNVVAGRRLHYIHADHLNTPRLLTDAGKNIVWRWDSDAYGVASPNEDPDQDGMLTVFDLRFPGQLFDGTLLTHYNINRDYDPLQGRYLQSDPIGLAGGINTYGYVYGNPTNYFDRDGLTPEGAAAGAIIGTGVGAIGGAFAGGAVGVAGGPAGVIGGGIAGAGQGAVDGAIIGAVVGDALSDLAAMAAPGNVADTQIIGDYNEAASKARQCGGKAPDRCEWLEQNKNRYRPDQVKATQKAWGCRRSRHGR